MKRTLFLLPIIAALLLSAPLQAQNLVKASKGAEKATSTVLKAGEAGAKSAGKARYPFLHVWPSSSQAWW